MKKRGARAHPASGAGNIKDDGSDEDYVYEIKDTAKASFRLVANDLRATYLRAIRQGKLAIWLVHFPEEGFTAEIRLVPDTPMGITS